MDKIISIIIVILILLATIAFYLAPFVGGLWQGAARSKVIAKILLLNRDLKLSSKRLSRLINPQNPYIVAVQKRVVTDTSDFKTLLSYNKCIRNVGFRTFPMHL
ncbi:hypothetical protein Lpl7_1032 [Lacticaseibacillus paracasei subsp. tolerans Lpl7]|uniref:Uncharacterized protein n=1 Tax=Lacticaseibacillus paracasei subsp. tolerans Lpl14 TaxID=1256229 RepID=A0A829GX76_LACPA|nr:hypothetical protein [Lacticaseibacillus paracasei]EPC14933.1 hypothetical protein Lpl7_1032 [Lacticaseibacillus paracasei subsp. tolerans Lpl7]EPC65485.1 hypothetical protein Lpl14_06918 [Lacticaseibacillus paracasei subsp. tolerans Lpl14]